MLSIGPDVKQTTTPAFVPTKLSGPGLENKQIMSQLQELCHSLDRLNAQGITVQTDPLENGCTNHKHRGGHAISEFKETPGSTVPGLNDKHQAVVIDCEMVTLSSNINELAFISAVDFVSGEVLINNFVRPSANVKNWNTRTSGITPSIMNRAIRSGQAIMGGWSEARAWLWRHIDANTVLVGHAIANDLNVLGMSHCKIVDSSIMTAEAVFPTWRSDKSLPRLWSLKTLASDFLGYQIQASRNGHSALEDVYATREVVIWAFQHPENYNAWVDAWRQQESERMGGVCFSRERAKEHNQQALEVKEAQAEGRVLGWETATNEASLVEWASPSPKGWGSSNDWNNSGREETTNGEEATKSWYASNEEETGWWTSS